MTVYMAFVGVQFSLLKCVYEIDFAFFQEFQLEITA